MSIPGISTLWVAALLVTQLSVKPPAYLLAQVTSETTTTPKSVTKTLTIDSAQVVYISDDDAVLKLSNGNLQLFELAPGTSLTSTASLRRHPISPPAQLSRTYSCIVEQRPK